MDITEDLHPNWRALATLHLPLKRFIREGTAIKDQGCTHTENHKINNISGAEAHQFYKKILQTNSTATTSTKPEKYVAAKLHNCATKELRPFDKSKYFRYACENNVAELQKMQITREDINARDAFGWTALMMAACEGAHAAVEYLCMLGIDKNAADKAGNTALDLARKKCQLGIVCLLERDDQSDDTDSIQHIKNSVVRVNNVPFYCNTCQCTFSETTKIAHQTSTVHQFNEKSILPSNKLNKFNISVKNRGLQLMVKQGWDREHGLGPNNNGRLYPVKTVLRKSRTGLGIEQTPARVTHFGAFDPRATERRVAAMKRKPSRNDIKREKVREWKRDRRLRNELS